MRIIVLVLFAWALIGLALFGKNFAFVPPAHSSHTSIMANHPASLEKIPPEPQCKSMDDEMRIRVCQSCQDDVLDRIAQFAIQHKGLVVTRDGIKYNFNLTGDGVAVDQSKTIGGN